MLYSKERGLVPAYSAIAMRDFRSIPEAAFCVLIKNKVLAEGVMRNHSPLPDAAFAYLWDTHVLNSDSPYQVLNDAARYLASRPLSPSQRIIVLTSDFESDTLERLLDYNELDPLEVTAMRLHDFTSPLSATLVRRYEGNDSVMAHIMTSLSDDTFALAVLRASPEVVPDEKVVSIVTGPFLKDCVLDSVVSDADATSAVRDLIETRPHLVPELLSRSDDPLVQVPVAQSHFVADPAILTTLLGRPESKVTKRSLCKMGIQVRIALSKNLYVSPELRALICECTAATRQFKSPYSLRLATAIAADVVLGDKAKTRLGTGLGPWDLLRAARDPGLDRHQAQRVHAALTGITARLRVGEARALEARTYLMEHFNLKEAPGTWFEPRVTLQLPSAWSPKPSPPLDLDGDVSMVAEHSKERDASPLVDIIGETPTAWLTFMKMLDCASLDASLRKLAHTVVRLCTS